MPIEAMLFVGGQLLATLIFSVVGLVAVGYRQRALHRELPAMSTEHGGLDAFQRFVAARGGILLATQRVNTYILLIAFIAILLARLTIDMLLPGMLLPFLAILPIFPLAIVLLFACIIGLYIGAYVHDIVGTVLVDAEAMQAARISRLQRGDVLRMKIKSTLFKTLPVVLYFEILGGSMLLGANVYATFLGLLLVTGAALLLTHVFALPFYASMNALRPIEQTEWAALASRIAELSRMAGVEFASVQVQQDLVGAVNIRTIGLGRPTLILSETFLRYSEWRQQDALIAVALGLVKKHIYLGRLLRNALLLLIVTAFVAAMPYFFTLAWNAAWLFPAIIALYIVLLAVRIGSRRFLREAYFKVDHFAAMLTKDPAAIIVALNTVQALAGVPRTQRSLFIPSTVERMQKLDALAWQPWPKAPQASMPVPAITTVNVGAYCLTTRFSQVSSVQAVR